MDRSLLDIGQDGTGKGGIGWQHWRPRCRRSVGKMRQEGKPGPTEELGGCYRHHLGLTLLIILYD